MKLRSIHLENVRNFAKLDFTFPEERIIAMEGKNTQGKTNFLESVFLLAVAKSFSPAKSEEIIMWGKDFARVSGSIESNGVRSDLEIFWGQGRKYPRTLKIQGAKRKVEEYIGTMKVVLFTPQEITLISDSPAARRKQLNIILSQEDRTYLKSLVRYRNTLRNRNALLKRIAEGKSKEDELEYWNRKLITDGGTIFSKRRKLLKKMNETMDDNFSFIAGKKHNVDLVWTREIPESEDDAKEWYTKKLGEMRTKDLAAQTTLVGPHRDDYTIMLDEKPIAATGSRGEWRTAVLAMKLCEIEWMKEVGGDSPILLLDDVLSEFDSSRQKNVLSLFHADQIIVTGTHIDHTNKDQTIFTVEKGTIKTKPTRE